MKAITSEENPYIETKALSDIADKTGNLYQSIAVVSARSKQMSRDLKEELTSKLEEFASSVDNLEEVHENREQIEISKYYEKLPHPVNLALKEFMDDETFYKSLYVEEGSEGEEAAE